MAGPEDDVLVDSGLEFLNTEEDEAVPSSASGLSPSSLPNSSIAPAVQGFFNMFEGGAHVPLEAVEGVSSSSLPPLPPVPPPQREGLSSFAGNVRIGAYDTVCACVRPRVCAGHLAMNT